MMETLQQILHRLRPTGWRSSGWCPALPPADRRLEPAQRDIRFTLQAGEGLDHLPDNINVSVHRIIQESPHQRRAPCQRGGRM